MVNQVKLVHKMVVLRLLVVLVRDIQQENFGKYMKIHLQLYMQVVEVVDEIVLGLITVAVVYLELLVVAVMVVSIIIKWVEMVKQIPVAVAAVVQENLVDLVDLVL